MSNDKQLPPPAPATPTPHMTLTTTAARPAAAPAAAPKFVFAFGASKAQGRGEGAPLVLYAAHRTDVRRLSPNDQLRCLLLNTEAELEEKKERRGRQHTFDIPGA